MKRAITILAGGFLSACAIFGPTLVDQKIVQIETKGADPVSIINANAYRDGGEMVVSGTTKYPISKWGGIFSGHVDVSVIEPDGRMLKSENIKVVRRRVPHTIGREAFFMTRFSIDPKKGTLIKIAYHTETHLKSN